jgi:hypothetical protein
MVDSHNLQECRRNHGGVADHAACVSTNLWFDVHVGHSLCSRCLRVLAGCAEDLANGHRSKTTNIVKKLMIQRRSNTLDHALKTLQVNNHDDFTSG